jgi:hypothetical protein
MSPRTACVILTINTTGSSRSEGIGIGLRDNGKEEKGKERKKEEKKNIV